ncbi:MAG: SEC-C metal-binding domain-containing protein [Candidatus Latescibacterota bacterium]|jgi:hypothetical protein
MRTDLADFVSDYVGSTHFSLLETAVKEHAEAILGYVLTEAGRACPEFPENADAGLFERVLTEGVARLDLPLAVRREAPSLLAAFFEYLASSGRFPPAGEWAGWVEEAGAKYAERFREDGSVKGDTVRRTLPSVGRNDPCPCGSGKKFKKCCIDLLG